MITRVTIRHFQSLVDVDLELGPLTIIEGRSSSGKSALMRAIRAAASNVRGPAVITRGTTDMAITVHTDTHLITLARGHNDGGRYHIVERATGKEQTYTKLGGAVPAAVTAALRIAPAGAASLNFAGQHDGPYMLQDSGAAVARTLGELTNVSTILRAVQEANRRRLERRGVLHTREQDLAERHRQAAAYATLPARLAARTEAERVAVVAQEADARRTRLHGLTQRLAVAQAVLDRAAAAPPVPDDQPLQAAAARLADFQTLVRRLVATNNAVAGATNAAQLAETAETQAHEALHAALTAAGTCPTCGQAVA